MAFIAKKGGWQPNQIPEGPIEVDWRHPLSLGLVGFWPLNATLIDLVGGNNLAPATLGLFAAGPNGPCLSRASTTNTGNAAPLAPFLGSGAISTFVRFSTKATATGQNNYIAYWGTTAVQNETFGISVENGVLWSRNNGSTANAGTGFNNGALHSYGWAKPSGATEAGILIYGDGASLTPTTSGTSVLNFSGTVPLTIGANPNTSGTGFVGTISGFRVYNRVLTPAEFEWLNAEPWINVRARSPRRVYSIQSSAPTYTAHLLSCLGVGG